MNPHRMPSEDELSLDSDERTLIVNSARLADLSGLSAANLFNEQEAPEAQPEPGAAGADVLRFDRASGGLVAGDGMGLSLPPPSSAPAYYRRRAARRAWRWALAALLCAGALTLTTFSVIHADRVLPEISKRAPWLDPYLAALRPHHKR